METNKNFEIVEGKLKSVIDSFHEIQRLMGILDPEEVIFISLEGVPVLRKDYSLVDYIFDLKLIKKREWNSPMEEMQLNQELTKVRRGFISVAKAIQEFPEELKGIQMELALFLTANSYE